MKVGQAERELVQEESPECQGRVTRHPVQKEQA